MKTVENLRRRWPLWTGIAVVIVLLSAAAMARPQAEESAWEELLRIQPEAVDDTTISPVERRILSRLTPEQARAWLAGADASEIFLDTGESLDLFVASLKALTTESLTFTPALSCTLVNTSLAGGRLAAGEPRTYTLRGPTRDYSAVGGSATGCGIPDLETLADGNRQNEVRAVMLRLRVTEAVGRGQLRVWPANYPQPVGDVVRYDESVPDLADSTLIVPSATSAIRRLPVAPVTSRWRPKRSVARRKAASTWW